MLKQVRWTYTARVLFITLTALMPTSYKVWSAANQEKLNQMTEAVNTFCLSGHRFHLDANVNGGISIMKRGGEIGTKVDVFKQPGAAAYLNEEIRRLADDDIRKCAEPYLKRIFDYIEKGEDSSTRREKEPGRSSTSTYIHQSTTGEKSQNVVTGSGSVKIDN